MLNRGYWITDWIFFLNERHKAAIVRILAVQTAENDVASELVTYKLITVFLPVVPFAFVTLLNIAMNLNDQSCWFAFINNGSLPIISFGIISAGMPYLLEQLEQTSEYHILRRRVMAVALIFLFVTAALYMFQTLDGLRLDGLTRWSSLIISVYVFFFCASIGYKMFILQSKNIASFAENVQRGVNERQQDLEDL